MRLSDGLVEVVECNVEHPEFGDVGKHLAVVQDSNDDAFGTHFLVGRGNGQDGDTEPDQRPVNTALDESVLGSIALEGVIATWRIPLNIFSGPGPRKDSGRKYTAVDPDQRNQTETRPYSL